MDTITRDPSEASATPRVAMTEAALKDFKRSVEITRDVRFQGNLRLSKRQRGSSYMVSILSLYVIAVSLLPNILDLNHSQNQILLACSIVLSVFIIFSSLIDGSQNFFHQGELLHACARKIATIHHKLKMIDVQSNPETAKDELEDLQKEYQKALDDCSVNHDNVDFYKEMADKPHLFPDYYNWPWNYPLVLWNKARWLFLSSTWINLSAIAVVVVSWVIYRWVFDGAVFVK